MNRLTLKGLPYVIELSKQNVVVRVIGACSKMLDHLDWAETNDALGYGSTIDEAALRALQMRASQYH